MNLQELLSLDRRLIVLDLETTGPNPREDRIVEIAFVEFKPDKSIIEPGMIGDQNFIVGQNGIQSREWSSYVNPGCSIPPAATAIHGITDETVKDAPTFAQLAPHLLRGFKGCDFAGYNLKSFDLPCLQAEFTRIDTAQYPTFDISGARIIDGYRLWQIGEPHSLINAAKRFLQATPAESHHALNDVRTTIDVITAQLKTFQTLPRNLTMLHDLQWPRDQNAIDPDGKFIWKDGVACINFGKKWKGVPLTSVAKDYLEWMSGADFSAPVKHIVREALQGRWPQKDTNVA